MSIVSFDFDDTLAWTQVIRDADGDIEDTVPAGVNPHIMPLLHAALDRGAAQVVTGLADGL